MWLSINIYELSKVYSVDQKVRCKLRTLPVDLATRKGTGAGNKKETKGRIGKWEYQN